MISHDKVTIKSYAGQHPQCFLRFFENFDTPDTVPSNKEEIRIKRKGLSDVLCYPKHNPMNYEHGWCHTKVANLVAKITSFQKNVFFREIIMYWEERRKGAGKEVGVSAAMNAFKIRTSQTWAFFVSKKTYMFFPRSCVNIM